MEAENNVDGGLELLPREAIDGEAKPASSFPSMREMDACFVAHASSKMWPMQGRTRRRRLRQFNAEPPEVWGRLWQYLRAQFDRDDCKHLNPPDPQVMRGTANGLTLIAGPDFCRPGS